MVCVQAENVENITITNEFRSYQSFVHVIERFMYLISCSWPDYMYAVGQLMTFVCVFIAKTSGYEF